MSSALTYVRLCCGQDNPTALQARKNPRVGVRGRQNGHNFEAANDTRETILDLRREEAFPIKPSHGRHYT